MLSVKSACLQHKNSLERARVWNSLDFSHTLRWFWIKMALCLTPD